MAEHPIEIPTEEIAAFCQQHQIRSLALFGSVLRDDFGSESDVDVLVEFQTGAVVGFLALGRMRRELATLLQHPVDLVPKNGLKPKIRDAVLDSAEVLYAI